MFSDKRKHRELSDEEEKDRLYQKIGQLEVELDWAKKNSDFSISKKREFIEPEHPKISIQRQCEILDLNRSSLYYSPRPIRAENQKLMNMMDEIYTDHPYYGYRRIREVLKRKGLRVNRKRVHRLMNLLGLQGICPKRNLSKPRKDHKKYPYLLRGVPIERSNQVWSSDITYCRLKGGYVYLTAVMDWFTKKGDIVKSCVLAQS